MTCEKCKERQADMNELRACLLEVCAVTLVVLMGAAMGAFAIISIVFSMLVQHKLVFT